MAGSSGPVRCNPPAPSPAPNPLAAQSVHVEGLAQFRRELRGFQGDVNRTTKQAHDLVADLVKDKAKQAARSAPTSRGPRSTRRGAMRLAESFRSSPTVKAARIVSSLPWAFGAEFGSHRFRRFPAFSGAGRVSQLPGYVGWAAVRNNETEIREEYAESLMEAFKGAYPIRTG